MFFLGNKDEI